MYLFVFFFFFFFQAEDGIRDLTVTGVQTCALPILLVARGRRRRRSPRGARPGQPRPTSGREADAQAPQKTGHRSDRVGHRQVPRLWRRSPRSAVEGEARSRQAIEQPGGELTRAGPTTRMEAARLQVAAL